MTQILKRIFSVLMAAIFFATATGFTFGIHHCDSSHENDFFLLQQDYKCKTELEKPKCCCAHKPSSDQKSNSIDSKSKCCHNILVQLKIENDFISSSTFLKSAQDFEVIIQNSPIVLTKIYSLPADYPNFYRPPPRFTSGKDLIITYHTLKIPFLIS